ncbi:lysozyme inhibitor LprI family protein [Methylobacterium sp. NEAU K]|uniref:lysozyme inhibitor LprI family protein n=1 Tax=Methylobacterium sp. NEAU K TaxID=3064946 RepID=UPI002735DFAB|nr:lysozyme inhibitor LprI family protein [Methylobacterium sp. NEAU K]MDP4003929.1 lysozyme inhibitor LprI family protein [Methylobacterium sp. NEAU K]
MTKVFLLALPLVLLAAAPARAASFPCEKAETPDEKAVCAHLPLNDMDVEMATRFDILKAVLPMGGQTKLRDDQEAWLKERRACGADVTCLRGLYETRLKVLRGVLSEFAKQGPQ